MIVKRIRSLLLVFAVVFYSDLKAQETNPVKDVLENLSENLGEDYDLSELTERLEFYLHKPIDLNKATLVQLKELMFLSPLQINNLLAYVSGGQRLTNVLELQGIDGFDVQTINRLLPFVRVQPVSDLKNISTERLLDKGNHDLILRYGRITQLQKGFRDLPGSRYLGTPDKVLMRYRYNYNEELSAALVAEKDAGEYWLRKNTGADHLSFNIAFRGKQRLKKLVLGDYSLQFGQGLTLWSGFAFGKGPDVTSVAAKDMGLRPYHSANEASFLRGAATTLQLNKHLAFTSFVSYRKVDASLKYDADSNASLQNINISGLHRTSSELKNQKSTRQLIYGMALDYASGNWNFGMAGHQSRYGHPFVTGTQAYNQYAFTGTWLSNTGVYYNYTYDNIYFYGEVAHSLGSGFAFLNAALVSISPKVSAVFLHRNYDRDYHNFLSNGVGEATEVSNEKGVYLGLNYSPVKKWMLSVYGDYFKFPWLKYRVDAASSGYECLMQITYQPSKTFKSSLRYKRELKAQNPDSRNSKNILDQVNKQSFRLDWEWKQGKQLAFHQRMECSGYQKGQFSITGQKREYGYLIFQDLDFKPVERLSGNFRIAYFNTPSYNSRIYAYEDDVLYGAASGVYHGEGFRYFLNLRFRLGKGLDCWGRYAGYLYAHQETIGSGLDEISGNQKTDFKLQIRYQF